MSDGFNLSQTGEHQFQFLDVSPGVNDAAHFYAPLPPQPQPVYLFQPVGIYPTLTSASVGAGTVLTSSGYVASVPTMIPPQMQSAGVMLPPGIIPAAAPTLLRPGMIQQPPAPGIILPTGLVHQPPAGSLPATSIMPTGLVHPPQTGTLPPTSIMPPHGAMLQLPHSVTHVPAPPVSELTENASTTLVAGQSTVAGADRFDNPPLTSMLTDVHINGKSAEHESGGCNANNSAAEHTQQSHSGIVLPVAAEFDGPVDRDASEHGNGEECPSSDVGMQCVESQADVDSDTVAAVNGELSVKTSHELASSSESSSVTSPSSVTPDMTPNDHSSNRYVTVMKHSSSHSPVMAVSTHQSSVTATTVASPSTATKAKAPSWASLLKDTRTATNAIVISVSDSHSAAAQHKADVKSVVKEPVTQQLPVSRVSNDEKLKLEVSGLYVLI